ncbi:hypothetical protein OPT61_g9774 [Boeremia exigua]|uniref:Uncharacterized protein n=1 Tax=Boeremia exigua TaxID=749465 RepID=A0ACC2HSL4_9PLEO|nr:hypothetical protein OPT61_g9774 [Boeremia exigua]
MGSLVRNCPTPVAEVRKPNRVVLVRRKEEHAVAQPAPDEHVRHNTAHEMGRVESHSADPVQGDEVPSQRARNRADVDGARGGRVAEVRKAQVEEVDDEQQLGEPEVAAHPQVDEAEEQQVGGDVVRADVCGGDEVGLVRRPEGPGVD